MDGNEMSPENLIRMLMRINGENLQTMYPKFGHRVYQSLQDQLSKNERLRFDELYAFVKYFGGSVNVEIPMPDGRMRTIELVCEEKKK